MKRSISTVVVIAGLVACGEPPKGYDSGFSDGYAVGFNSVCYPKRTNIIWGDWDSEHYSAGYSDGKSSGIYDAKAAQKGENRMTCSMGRSD